MCSPVGGLKFDVHHVAAHTSEVFHVNFRGDEDAAVIISGKGDTDVDLYVSDEQGNLPGSCTDVSHECVVGFQSRWTSVFRIEVRNVGRVYRRYQFGCL